MYRPEDIGTDKWVRCGFRDCHLCCLETEMILSEEDVQRISDAGYSTDDFLLPTETTDNYYQLRNVDSKIGRKCFFLSDKGECTIYPIAPAGCKLYPLIVNLDTDETMVDIDCREHEWFRAQKYYKSQVISIKELVNTLQLELEERTNF